MSVRELVVLGTASQVPTRERSHHAALLRWDDEGVLFDPGEGAQRQLAFAGVRASTITRICLTHFHGDHCLGLPGILQRLRLDEVTHPVDVYFPAAGQPYYERLTTATVAAPFAGVRAHPCVPGTVATAPAFTITARALEHRTATLGWRLAEPDGRRMLPDRLAAAGVAGPDVGRLAREGVLDIDGRQVHLADVSEHRPGQVVAFVMDTRLCDAAFELAADADLLVCEATFLDDDADLAERYRHLTAGQAGRIAAEAGARRLLLTHFSRRYPDPAAFAEQAGAWHPDVVVARDLDRVAVPPRR